MTLSPAQTEIVRDRHRFRVVDCGRRFGKTTLASLEIAGKAVSKNDARVCYVAPTYQQARDILWRDLKRTLRPAALSINESRLEIEVQTKDGGSALVWLRGWESIETLRGQRFDFLVLDEVASMRNFWLHWQEVLRPTLTDTRGEALFLSTPKGYNHFYDLFGLEKTDPDFRSFHFTSYDNPHIPAEEIEAAKRQLTEDRFAQEYLADFRKVHGLVYKDFDRGRHVTASLPPNRAERILGVDFGFTNPTAVLTIDKDKDGTYFVVSEWYKPGKTNIEVIEYARSQTPNALYPDPAEPDRIEEMRRHGLNVRDVSKDIEAGVTKVQELFRANRIKVHTSCVNLISELESYAYPDRKPNHNEPETPIKENDHACDALRYALFMNVQGGTGFIPPPTTGLVKPFYPGLGV
jgi:PBSX family phage terminase large subunit